MNGPLRKIWTEQRTIILWSLDVLMRHAATCESNCYMVPWVSSPTTQNVTQTSQLPDKTNCSMLHKSNPLQMTMDLRVNDSSHWQTCHWLESSAMNNVTHNNWSTSWSFQHIYRVHNKCDSNIHTDSADLEQWKPYAVETIRWELNY